MSVPHTNMDTNPKQNSSKPNPTIINRKELSSWEMQNCPNIKNQSIFLQEHWQQRRGENRTIRFCLQQKRRAV